jgi:hypothetical protein
LDGIWSRNERGCDEELLIGMLLLGGVIAVIAVIVGRRSGAGVDEWDSFAGDTDGRPAQSLSHATVVATESVSKVANPAKDSVSKAANATNESASKAADTAKDV